MNDISHITQEDFPPQLLEIPQSPEKLYIRGAIPKKDALYLTVVGSRKHTSYGKDVCEKIIKDLAAHLQTSDVQRFVIVSGLALGIDAVAHRAALKAGLTTIAFPGSGLDSKVLYPAAHHGLAENIITGGGTLVSEFEPHFKATPYSFPQRNRLMAGIARGVLIIEAEELSGTLITARLATEYNRDVFTVPGSIFSPQSKGVHQLLKQGAIPVTSGSDILTHWNITEVSSTKYHISDILNSCSPDEQTIIRALEEPLSRETLREKTGLEIHACNIALSTLELKGIIKESLGEIYLNS